MATFSFLSDHVMSLSEIQNIMLAEAQSDVGNVSR